MTKSWTIALKGFSYRFRSMKAMDQFIINWQRAELDAGLLVSIFLPNADGHWYVAEKFQVE